MEANEDKTSSIKQQHPKVTKVQRRQRRRALQKKMKKEEAIAIETVITTTEDERTNIAKTTEACPRKQQIQHRHTLTKPRPSILQKGANLGRVARTCVSRLAKRAFHQKGVQFAKHVQYATFTANKPAAISIQGQDEPRPLIFKQKARQPITKRTKRRINKQRRKARLHAERDEANAVMASYDSAADAHYVAAKHQDELLLPILRLSTKMVTVANGQPEKGEYRTRLPIPNVPPEVAEADTFKNFQNTLISVGQMANAGCISIFHRKGVDVYKEEDILITVKGKPVMMGIRDEHGRFKIPLVPAKGTHRPRVPTKDECAKFEEAQNVYDLPSVEEAIKWLHASCGFPAKRTWIKAIKKGNFASWPLLSAKRVEKYFPETKETPKGHLNQARRNVRSTKIATKAMAQPFEPTDTQQLRGKQGKEVLTRIDDTRETIFSDQTGAFPKRSQRGNKYVMVMVHIDSNAILLEPMKSKKDAEMQRAYNALLLRLKRAGIVPKKHIMDNEVSDAMKNMIRDDHRLILELVPPGCHRRNAAEVAIRNFKQHFLSIMAGVADDFPWYLWDRLLPQAELTLNLLRQSNTTPNVSAHAHMFGFFDFNRMPLAPMGCSVQVHEPTNNRGTWDFHTVDGWYLHTSPEHYRTHVCHAKETRSERLSDTVHFMHKNITNPTVAPADKLMLALSDVNDAIQAKASSTTPEQMDELQQLVERTRLHIHNNRERINELQRDIPQHVAATPPRRSNRLEQQQPRVLTTSTTPTAAAPPRVPPVPRVAPTEQPSPHVAEQPPTVLQPILKRKPLTPNKPPTVADGPATRTRSKSNTRAPTATSDGPANNTRAKTKERIIEIAAAVQELRGVGTSRARKRPSKGTRKLAKRLLRLENEIHQAMAVMDQETGKMMKYRQLIRHPTLGKDWRISGANEFGRLAKGYVYVKVTKGMYGLPQSGLLANELLEQRLNEAGYHQSKLVPGLWKHDWRPIQFTLVVDDFGVKYVGREHAEHLEAVLKEHYPVKTEWDGGRYIGLFLKWDYEKRQVHLSVPGFTAKALKQFQHKTPTRKQNAPFPYTPPNYGAKQQFAKEDSTAEPLDKKGKLFIQQVCGKFLWLGRAVDSTLLVPVSAIASQMAQPTTETMAQTNQLLDYIAAQEEAVLTYSASEMILAVHSDASYLSEPKARSRAGGHFFLSNNSDIPPNNGAILNIAHIIKNVMSSATEAELAALYIMAREAVYIRIILEEMGHEQPPTPMQTDNSMAEGVINNKVQPKRTKAMDMRFHWLRDRECQQQFRFYWRPGRLNYADYWTKHHSAKHHANIRPEFLTPQKVLETIKHSNIKGSELLKALARV
eukprot:scaffold4568_cov78-Skeletonema_dohrnii-CCMP3373.AAC.1